VVEKRAYRSGSLYQRKSDGRWIGSLPDGHGGSRGYVTGTDRADVERRLAKLASSSTSPRKPPSDTVAKYLVTWLDEAATTTLRPRTVEAYQDVIDGYIVPAVGRIRLVDLEAQDVARMVTGVLKAGRSPQTAKHAHKVLRVALGQAERRGLVTRNVATLVKSPRVVRPTLTALSAADARRFLSATRGHPRWPLYVLAITTGMRRGELLAIRWQDVDLVAGELRVEHTIRQVSRWRFALDEPKTDRSRRTLPLSRLAVEALKVQKSGAPSAAFVFARADGRPLPAAEVTREFQAALTAHGFPKIRLHDLRHTAAQIMLEQSGGDLRQVMTMLGHSTLTTTVDTYGGAADDAKRRARDGMDRAMEGLG
jgi:integrase